LRDWVTLSSISEYRNIYILIKKIYIKGENMVHIVKNRSDGNGYEII